MDGTVHGQCDARFAGLPAALEEEIAAGEELGASIAVDIDGELVVDIWGGFADRAKTVAWGQDTIVNFFSCTKPITALAALVLIDRGQLDPFAPVAAYWPEFAENGKQDIEVRHLLAHTSGVSGWEPPVMNPELRTTFAYVMNKMGPGTTGTKRTIRYANLIYEVLS